MIIFVDGFQGTGKTTLLENCKYKHNRFPFNEYLDNLRFDDINGYQMGKDLGICFLSQYIRENIVLDRGPFSTIFYSLKENRFGEETSNIMIRFLSLLRGYKNCKFVWIKKINDDTKQERNHEDGFDYLDDENDPNKEKLLDDIIRTCEVLGVDLHIFENDFSKKLKQNYHEFNNFLEGLFNEHNRD